MDKSKDLETEQQCDIHDVSKRYYLTKNRQGDYQLLNELAYEKKLIYG